MSIEQRLDMEREDRRHESTLARLTRQLKFAWHCPECGSDFGMLSATREQMAEFLPGAIERFMPWYREPGNDLILYHQCWQCNFGGRHAVPDGLEPLSVEGVLAWFSDDADPMASD